MIAHTAFFGDGEHRFALTDEIIQELEAVTGIGIGALYLRAVAMQFSLTDITEVIRLGLIGGGKTPEEAHRLTHAYARRRPIAETFPLALDILDARWNGKPDEVKQ